MRVVRFLRPTGAWVFLVVFLALTAWAHYRPTEEVALDTHRPEQVTETAGGPKLP